MKKNHRKRIVIMLIISLFIAGCGATKTEPAPAKEEAQTQVAESPAAEEPATDESQNQNSVQPSGESQDQESVQSSGESQAQDSETGNENRLDEYNTVLFESEDVTVKTAGFAFGEKHHLYYLNVLIENNTDMYIMVYFENLKLNGQDIELFNEHTVKPHYEANSIENNMNALGSRKDLEDFGVLSPDDVETISFDLVIGGRPDTDIMGFLDSYIVLGEKSNITIDNKGNLLGSAEEDTEEKTYHRDELWGCTFSVPDNWVATRSDNRINYLADDAVYLMISFYNEAVSADLWDVFAKEIIKGLDESEGITIKESAPLESAKYPTYSMKGELIDNDQTYQYDGYVTNVDNTAIFYIYKASKGDSQNLEEDMKNILDTLNSSDLAVYPDASSVAADENNDAQ